MIKTLSHEMQQTLLTLSIITNISVFCLMNYEYVYKIVQFAKYFEIPMCHAM